MAITAVNAQRTPGLPWFLSSRLGWVKSRARRYERISAMDRRACVAAAAVAYAQACMEAAQ